MAKPIDIVYLVKECEVNNELMYSLRSVEANWPVRKVWFYGGCPQNLKPDNFKPVVQHWANKWENVNQMLRMVVENDDITEDFWLFNDDFFILVPMDDPKDYYLGDLAKHIEVLSTKYGAFSPYVRQLRKTRELLIENGYGTRDFTLHLPLKVNRAKAKQTLDKFQTCPMFRSLYGNMHNIPAEQRHDVKIFDEAMDWRKYTDYLSTNDSNFNFGEVGKMLKRKFDQPSRWELWQ